MFKYHNESLWHCSGKLKKIPRNAVEMYGLWVDHLASTGDLSEKLQADIKQMSTAVRDDRCESTDIRELKDTVTTLQATVSLLYEADLLRVRKFVR